MTTRARSRLPSTQTEAISRAMSASSKWQWVAGHWETLRPKLIAYWPRLPDSEVRKLTGDRPSLVRLVKRYYAVQEAGAEAQVDAWVAGLPAEARSGVPPPARTTDEQRAESEGMGSVPGASTLGPTSGA